jgi:hypothetical protein
MADLINKSKDILDRFEASGHLIELSRHDSAQVATSINKGMKEIKRDFNKKESESNNTASKVIITA